MFSLAGAVAALSMTLGSGIVGAQEGAVTVEPRAIADRKAVFATVESADTLHARARIGGTVGSLAVDDGDPVKAGDVIAVVGDPKLMLQLRSTDARINSLRAQVDQAGTELNRAEQLFRQGVIAQARLDQARTALQVFERNLNALQAERQVVVQQATEGQVLAPTDGRVLDVLVIDGSVVMPGEPVALIASDTYLLRMEVPERHARFIRVGDSVEVGDRGLAQERGGAMRRGEVVKVYPKLENGRVRADIRVDGLGDYFVGERAVVYVATGERQAIVLPADYLTLRFGVTYATLDTGRDVVVQTGNALDGGVEILSGLRAGDVVVKPQVQAGKGTE
ncbi:efflux RND transporter periplasmic adaptor subunit [Novispirillum sp. DQ9]|uniref:efflux RND transporter periplasmic adaptor subunit n=1 Tax=Novispirillum sp. DQ9 TaxID=3398612 RepID=UPI003C7E3929